MIFFVIVLVLWIFSVCVHEFAHAAVAYWGGDHSVADKGYLTLNPIRYTDPLTSLALPLLFLALGGIGLPGGAVYVNDLALRGRGWRSAVSLAGPVASAVLLVLLALPFMLGIFAPRDPRPIACLFAFLAGLQATAVIFNLLPVPPLDGFGVLAPFMPADTHQQIQRLGQWPFLVLILVLMNSDKAALHFWRLVGHILYTLHVPPHLFHAGFRHFQFWLGS